MTEYGRFAQDKLLESQGFYHDEDCIFYEKEISCGGPSYIKSANGLMHWYSCGNMGLLSGTYLREISDTEYVELVYENGKLYEYGLPRKKIP